MIQSKKILVRAFAVLLATAFVASMGFVDSAAEEPSKEYWQSEYRALRLDIARLERNAKRARHNYERAQRRTYPRGDARKQYLIDEQDALDGVVRVKREIEDLKDRGRREGALPGWFYEVDDEPLTPPEPAAPDGPNAEGLEEREGRNPLYFQDDN